MSKIEKVYNIVCYAKIAHKDEKNYQGINTSEVAKKMNIYRSEASALLNKLVSDGKLMKNGTRPVLYTPITLENDSYTDNTPTDNEQSCLDQIIGADSSLKYQIDLARSAISYPPLGLHTLITGESGTGKSMLAEKMWQYACEIRKRKDIPFITFSCAEYADNPQLILEQLFGHKKGAFTGAAQDRPGLVEKANGGILFLDEIHRLPPTCQELLFILMDKGMIRRIGDNEDIPISLQIIGATSENISNILLKTFRRRMPVNIYMPTLAERSTSEHLSLIKLFLQEEAFRIKKNIHITGKALQAFLNYNGEGNIGDLKSNLLISCAKSFVRSKTGTLTITVYDIPQLVYITNKEIDHSYSPYIQEVSQKGITFYADKKRKTENSKDAQNFDFYHFSKTHIPDFDASDERREDSACLDNDYIERYYEQSLSNLKLKQLDKESVPDIVLEATSYIIRHAYLNKGRAFDEAIQAAIMLHLKQFYYLIKSNHVIYNPELKKINIYYEKEVQIVKEMLPELQRIFGVNILDDEIGFLSILLSKTADQTIEFKRKVLLVSFGASVASSIASFAKQSFDSDCIEFLNIPFRMTPAEIFEMVHNKIKGMHEAKELLILTDIPSLVSRFQSFKNESQIPCTIIPVISPILTLEASKIIHDNKKSLSSITEELKTSYLNYINCLLKNESLIKNDLIKKEAIIIYSIHGRQHGEAIQKLLFKKIKASNAFGILIACSEKEVQMLLKSYDNVHLIIGDRPPKDCLLPYYGLENLIFQEGIQKITIHLQYDEPLLAHTSFFIQNNINRKDLNLSMKNVTDLFAPSFPIEELFQHGKNVIEELELQVFHRTLSADSYVRGYLYFVSMAEKLFQKKKLPLGINPQIESITKARMILQQELKTYTFLIPYNEIKQFLSIF